jgi:transketolase
MPGMTTIRPADANETREAWEIALERRGPTVLALTRQKLPVLDRPAGAHARRGAYVLREAPGGMPSVILIATGSEVEIACEAARILEQAGGPPARVVSMPSWELFAEQPEEWRDSVLPPSVRARVAVEAGTSFGWERHVGSDGAIVAIDRFGASGKYEEIYEAFGITAQAVAAKASEVAGRTRSRCPSG